MLNGKTVAVLLPAYNEERQIGKVIQTMPAFVDYIVVINDGSKDNTEGVVRDFIAKDLNSGNRPPALPTDTVQFKTSPSIGDVEVIASPSQRYILINHKKNMKKGTAVANGYVWCRENKIDCTAIMDADGQMDPAELEPMCLPIVNGFVDYTKGNRLIHKLARETIPTVRFIGNSILSLLTKIASGYWRISDTQSGFTAISQRGLNAIDLYKLYRDYGIPNDIIVKLNIAYCSIQEVEIRPIYNVGEQSKMKIHKVIPRLSWLLLKLFIYRLWKKYFIRDFHPLFLLYHMGFFLMLMDIPFFIRICMTLLEHQTITFQTLFAFTFFSVMGFQSIVFAMWMDMQDNARLYREP